MIDIYAGVKLIWISTTQQVYAVEKTDICSVRAAIPCMPIFQVA